MPVPGDGPTVAVPLYGLTGSSTIDLTQMTVSWGRPLPVTYGVLEDTAWFRMDPETPGMIAMNVSGPAGWQGVIEIYEQSEVWGTDDFYLDWWIFLGAAAPGQTVTVPVAQRRVYIRLHPFNTHDPVTDATLSWTLTPAEVAKFYGVGHALVDGVTTTEYGKITIPLVQFTGDGGLEAEDPHAVEIQQVSTPVQFSGTGQLDASKMPRGVVRWQFHDSHESDMWTVPINPNSMSSPHAMRQYTYAQGVDQGIERLRVFEQPHPPVTWEFGGFIRTKQHHDKLLYWCEKEHEIEVTDHLDRTFSIIIQQFNPQDRRVGIKPGPDLSDDRRWRMSYTITALILRRVS